MAGVKSPFPKLMLKAQHISFGKGCGFYGVPIIYKGKGSSIEIGNRVTVNSGVLSNLIGLYQRSILIARSGGRIVLGNDVGMSGATLYARSAIRIGDSTLIGANTKLMDNDFHPVDPGLRRQNPNANIAAKPIEIGKNVFIGCNCLILKGTIIGDNTTIGAGSVVSGVIPANCVAAGNPAHVIKTFLEDADKKCGCCRLTVSAI